MNQDEKLNEIIARLADLTEQVNLIQAMLLELSRKGQASIGRRSSGRQSEGLTAACEDQCSACQE